MNTITGRSFQMSSELSASDVRMRLIKARETDSPVIHVDFAATEARILVDTQLKAAVQDIARRAGVKSGNVAVYFAHLKTQPPRMQWVGRDDVLLSAGTPRSQRRHRRVIVGSEWIMKRAPNLWAAFVAARLIGLPTLPLAPTWGDNNKRI